MDGERDLLHRLAGGQETHLSQVVARRRVLRHAHGHPHRLGNVRRQIERVPRQQRIGPHARPTVARAGVGGQELAMPRGAVGAVVAGLVIDGHVADDPNLGVGKLEALGTAGRLDDNAHAFQGLRAPHRQLQWFLLIAGAGEWGWEIHRLGNLCHFGGHVFLEHLLHCVHRPHGQSLRGRRGAPLQPAGLAGRHLRQDDAIMPDGAGSIHRQVELEGADVGRHLEQPGDHGPVLRAGDRRPCAGVLLALAQLALGVAEVGVEFNVGLDVLRLQPRCEQIRLARLHRHVLAPAGPRLGRLCRDVHLGAAFAEQTVRVDTHRGACRSLPFGDAGPGGGEFVALLEAAVFRQVPLAGQQCRVVADQRARLLPLRLRSAGDCRIRRELLEGGCRRPHGRAGRGEVKVVGLRRERLRIALEQQHVLQAVELHWPTIGDEPEVGQVHLALKPRKCAGQVHQEQPAGCARLAQVEHAQGHSVVPVDLGLRVGLEPRSPDAHFTQPHLLRLGSRCAQRWFRFRGDQLHVIEPRRARPAKHRAEVRDVRLRRRDELGPHLLPVVRSFAAVQHRRSEHRVGLVAHMDVPAGGALHVLRLHPGGHHVCRAAHDVQPSLAGRDPRRFCAIGDHRLQALLARMRVLRHPEGLVLVVVGVMVPASRRVAFTVFDAAVAEPGGGLQEVGHLPGVLVVEVDEVEGLALRFALNRNRERRPRRDQPARDGVATRPREQKQHLASRGVADAHRLRGGAYEVGLLRALADRHCDRLTGDGAVRIVGDHHLDSLAPEPAVAEVKRVVPGGRCPCLAREGPETAEQQE